MSQNSKYIDYGLKIPNLAIFKTLLSFQVLIEAVCLRRTKKDKINGKPLVALPSKTVTVRELEFTKEERTVYDAYQKQAQVIIERYMKR
jgi:SWI/SNF-related matrix-associated actin-dependent regulator of chromatin subfamily A3